MNIFIQRSIALTSLSNTGLVPGPWQYPDSPHQDLDFGIDDFLAKDLEDQLSQDYGSLEFDQHSFQPSVEERKPLEGSTSPFVCLVCSKVFRRRCDLKFVKTQVITVTSH